MSDIRAISCYEIKENRGLNWKIKLSEVENQNYISLINAITARNVIEVS